MIGEPSIREVSEFLMADGYVVTVEEGGARLLARDSTPRRRDDLRIWLPTLASDGKAASKAMLAELAQARAANPAVANLILLPTMPELGTEFLRDATAAQALVRTFGFFFDSPYRQGGAPSPVGSGTPSAAIKAADAFRSDDLFRPELLIGTDAERTVPAKPGRSEWRVAQPFVIQASVDEPAASLEGGADLLLQLIADAASPTAGASVTLVVGPAGIGKSVLFSAFFTYLYSSFQQAKLQQREAARPIAILPAHLASLSAMRTSDLLNALTTTVGARPMSPALLDWSLKTGRALLLCDGLDEFFAEQTDFFAEIDRRHLSGGGQARYYIFLRDTLLGTSPSLAHLLSDLAGRGVVTRIYRMLKWQQVQRVDGSDPRRTLVWLRREGRRPAPGEADTAATAAILQKMRADPVLWELAGLPLFCELLITELSQGSTTRTVDQYDLLEFLLDQLANREWDKLAPFDATGRGAQEEAFIWRQRAGELLNWMHATDWSLASWRKPRTKQGASMGGNMAEALATIRRQYGTKGLYEVLEEIAFDYRCHNPGHDATPPAGGLGVARMLAKYRQLADGIDKRIEAQGQRILTQFALFTQGNARTVDFAHPIVADFLAARFALRALRAAPENACRLLDHTEPDDAPVFFGYLRREADRDEKLGKRLRAMAASTPPGDCRRLLARVIGD